MTNRWIQWTSWRLWTALVPVLSVHRVQHAAAPPPTTTPTDAKSASVGDPVPAAVLLLPEQHV